MEKPIPTTSEDMKGRIGAPCVEISSEMLHHVQRSLRERLDAYIVANDHYFEQNWT